jgi:mannan endo-1,4-beta-mannosidase
VRLWVNDVDLFGDEHWVPQDSVTDCATVSLTAGQSVPIRMEFFDLTEEAIAKLEWSWPGHAEEVVPASSLYAQ